MIDHGITASVDLSISEFKSLGHGILPRMDAMREVDPIYWSEANQAWMVTSHPLIAEAASQALPLLSNDRLTSITLGRFPVEDWSKLYPTIARYMPKWIVSFDPPTHTRLRKLLVQSMNRKVVEALRPFIQQRVDELLDRLERQPQLEFNEEIARALTGSVILKLIGLPAENLGRLRGWANALLEAAGNPFATDESLRRMDAAMAEMNEVLGAEIQKRRVAPQEDLLTAMTKANEDGDTLSMDEMLGLLHILVIAGHDSTMNSMTLGVVSLSRNAGFWDHMYRNPSQTPNCVLELMREIAMATTQSRVATGDFEWHGKQIKKGQVVNLMLAAGNRDPSVFPDPYKLDAQRANLDKSLTFNPGIHHCVGHGLAKLQLGVFFGELVRRFSGADILEKELDFLPGPIFRGLYQLNARFTPRAAAACDAQSSVLSPQLKPERSIMKTISTYAKFKIHQGQLAAFQDLARQASTIVNTQEPGTLFYEWYLNADGTECVALDCYTDIEAMKTHVRNIGPIMRQLMTISDRYLEIYGMDPLPALKGASTAKSDDFYGPTFLSKLENRSN